MQNTLLGDQSTGGAGLSIVFSSVATIDHCSFTNNTIVGDTTNGAGLLIYGLSGGATVTNSNFSFNSVVGELATGGGMYHLNSPSLYMSNCIFTNNTVKGPLGR